MKRYLVIGATSAIARACCRQWLAEQSGPDGEPVDFFLAGRSQKKLEQTAADLKGRGARNAAFHVFDVTDVESQAEMLQEAWRALGHFDVALIAHGTLPDQQACERDPVLALQEFAINGTSSIMLLTRLADIMERQGKGTVAVITSVAGDRGRPSNYLYGSAKAAVSTFCEGLRARLFRAGVSVLDIRPGFVDTPMTAELDLPRVLVATPETVAKRITAGIARKRGVIYAPAFWWWILAVIRSIPGPLFKRLPL
jgi:decaprenylphospho-beta-D-erythro-pentofuranosid-2-ulose 2-reductase